MRAYGAPRTMDRQWPDLLDIRNHGLPSASSRCRGKGGDIKNSFRRSTVKRTIRRFWKKRERLASKRNITNEIEEITNEHYNSNINS
jgi:hypothetical protein